MLILDGVVVLWDVDVLVVDVCWCGVYVGVMGCLLVCWLVLFVLLWVLVEVWLGDVGCDVFIGCVFGMCYFDDIYCVWLCVEIGRLCVLL